MLEITRRDRKRLEQIGQKTPVSKKQRTGHLARTTGNCSIAKMTMWFPRDIKRPRGVPNFEM